MIPSVVLALAMSYTSVSYCGDMQFITLQFAASLAAASSEEENSFPLWVAATASLVGGLAAIAGIVAVLVTVGCVVKYSK